MPKVHCRYVNHRPAISLSLLGFKPGTIVLYLLVAIAEPEEIASMVHFLSTNEADFITGRMHIVDGGWGVH